MHRRPERLWIFYPEAKTSELWQYNFFRIVINETQRRRLDDQLEVVEVRQGSYAIHESVLIMPFK